MSRPRDPDPHKLFLSAIYREAQALDEAMRFFTSAFGESDLTTRELPFIATHYYEREMGAPLFRRFFTFHRLVDPGELANIKLLTNKVEKMVSNTFPLADLPIDPGRRVINLDPGLLGLNNLVLATGKAVAHRPYLGKGIYVDLTLIYESGTFKPLPWTYPDYSAPDMINFLRRVREVYKLDLKQLRDGE